MRLSEERIAALAKLMVEELLNEEHVDLEIDEDRFEHLIEARIIQLLTIEDEIDEEAATWMKQHKPNIHDGSHEFDIELERVKKTLADQRGYVLY